MHDPHAVLARIGTMTHEEMAATLALLDELESRKRVRLAQEDFLAFIAAVDPTYKFGAHLKRLGRLLMRVEEGAKDRIAVSMPPRFGKSLMISIYYPAWYLGKHPDHKVITASHTSDLAVDMARKVRNLMQSDEYKKIFPGVQIAADAKAAGKWDTSKGGTMYASGVGGALAGRGGDLCCIPTTTVLTRERGFVSAGSVRVGEHLRSWHGWAPVLVRIEPYHEATYTVAGRLRVSAQHPIWTFSRGWVDACSVRETDVLWTTSIFGRIKAHLQGAFNGIRTAWAVALSRVQHLGVDASAVHQPESGQLRFVRRCGYYGVRALERLHCFLRGYGAPTVAAAYIGSNRSDGSVFSGELPVGGYRNATEQPQQRAQDHGFWRDTFCAPMGASDRLDARHGSPSHIRDGHAPRGSTASRANEPQPSAGYSAVSGWFRSRAARILGRCGEVITRRLQKGKGRYLERTFWKSQDFAGLLLGVRLAGSVAVEYHAPRRFVNFMVGGDHTFIGDSILTHNCIVDDPLSEQDLKAGNMDSLDAVYEWFRMGLRTRLMPGGRICVLHCLTGDTSVLMADGTQTALRDVRPGDMVASYDAGRFRAAKVLGWANQGLDRIYAIALKSGNILRGNERHPFLVSDNGVERWVTVKNLRPGMRLVSTTGVQTLHTLKGCEGSARAVTTESTLAKKLWAGPLHRLKNAITRVLRKGALGSGGLDCALAPALRATHESTTTAKTLMPRSIRWGITGSGEVSCAASMAAGSLRTPLGCVYPAEEKPGALDARPRAPTIALKLGVVPTSKLATDSLAQNTTSYSLRRTGIVQFAESLRTTGTLPLLGRCADWLSTTATALAEFARSCVTSAISLLKAATPLSDCRPLLNTLSATLDEIVAITPDGEEEVFDIQVEGTENFLANGVVSHNTRWATRDLIGRLVKDAAMNPEADQYEVFEFPAILTTPNPDYDVDDPDSASEIQKSLWPEQWPLEALLRTKASMPAWQWNAQYMQTPTAQEAAIIKKDAIRWWPKEEPPTCDFVVQSWDTALTTKERSDYSACQTWGVWTTEDGVDQVILLNSVRGKYEFPELKRVALAQVKEWEPDALIVEAKASGQPLIDELRRSGIFVQDFSPGKGQDKIARVNAIADMFASGQVWFPETWWASEVVDELLAFPAGDHDDLVDALSLALRRIRQGGLMKLTTDYEDPVLPLPRRNKAYY